MKETIAMDILNIGGLWARITERLDGETILAAGAVGLTVAWRVFRWQYRARIERRLQAAAAAYAARELSHDTRHNESRVRSGSRSATDSRNLISRSEMTTLRRELQCLFSVVKWGKKS